MLGYHVVEYILFVARARQFSDADRVAEQIESFRRLSEAQRAEVVKKCDAFALGGPKRASLYNTIRLNRTYAYKMWNLSGLFEFDEESNLALKRSALRGPVRDYVDDY